MDLGNILKIWNKQIEKEMIINSNDRWLEAQTKKTNEELFSVLLKLDHDQKYEIKELKRIIKRHDDASDDKWVLSLIALAFVNIVTFMGLYFHIIEICGT